MQIAATLRRSSFFSLLLIGLISLKILGVLSVLSGLSFGLAIILIEIFFSNETQVLNFKSAKIAGKNKTYKEISVLDLKKL